MCGIAVALLLIHGCKSEVEISGGVKNVKLLSKYDFASIRMPALKEGAISTSQALQCERVEKDPAQPSFRIKTVSESLVNCSLQSGSPSTLSCSPLEKAGTRNWIADLEVCCSLAGQEICQTLTVDVFDKDFDTANLTLNTIDIMSPKAIYTKGDTIELSITFPEVVTVDGSPTLSLQFDAGTQKADYKSGSGSRNLLFSYIVQEGDETLHLEYTSALALNLDGGTIQLADGSAADTRLPTVGASGSLSRTTDVAVDTTDPTAAQSVGFAYAFSGGSLVVASWQNGSDSNFKTHHVKLCTSNDCESGCQPEFLFASSPGSLTSIGGTFHACVKAEDQANRVAAWTPSAFTVTVDTSAPTLLSVSSPLPNGVYKTGTVIPIDITTSKIVLVTSPADLSLRLNNGRNAAYLSGSGSSTLRFSYTVGSGDDTNLLDYLGSDGLVLGAATIRDVVGNDVNPTLPAPGTSQSLALTSSIGVDTVAPLPPSAITFLSGTLNPGKRVALEFTTGTDTHLKEHHAKACANTGCSASCSAESTVNAPEGIIENVAPNATYYACVQAVDTAGNVSPWAVSSQTTNVLEKAVKALAKNQPYANSNCAILEDDSLHCWGIVLGIQTFEHLESPSDIAVDFGPGKYVLEAAVGLDHVCAILNDRSVRCWGENGDGQLGYGDTTFRRSPSLNSINLGPGKTAKHIALGPRSSCAILNDDSVKCWGKNNDGILGYGDTVTRLIPPDSPINFGARVPADIKVGDVHTCVRFQDTSFICWGSGDSDPLGYGVGAISAPPAANNPVIASGVVDVSLMERATCVLLESGDVKCWGRNDYSLLGYGDSNPVPSRFVPSADVLNFGGLKAKSIASGNAHTCAVLEDGSVSCWGRNYQGGVGAGDLLLQPSPIQVNLGAGRTARSLVLVTEGTCALLDTFEVKCWGSNTYGLNGLGEKDINRKPVQPLTGTFKSVAVSRKATCAVLTSGSVKCWGDNGWGTVGSGEKDRITGPSGASLFTFGADVEQVAMGAEHTCVRLSNNEVNCWGEGSDGRIGSGNASSRFIPDTSSHLIQQGGGTLIPLDLVAGEYHSCVIARDSGSLPGVRDLYCWGDDNNYKLGYNGVGGDLYQIPAAPVNLGGATVMKVALGLDHTCAVLSDNTLKCWGSNANGQLGIGSADTERATPVSPTGLGATVADVAAGYSATCALLVGGQVKCWGQNSYGQLGAGNYTSTNVPPVATVDLGAGRTAQKIFIRDDTTCALLDDFSVKCWGENYSGQSGVPTQQGVLNRPNNIPINLGPSRSAKDIAIGRENVCSILDDDTLRCWGYSSSYQLGRNYNVPNFEVPSETIDFWAGARVLKVTSTTNDTKITTAGTSVMINLTFSQAVVVSGTGIGIKLETGATDEAAVYESGSGTNILSFRYVTQSGNANLNLDYLPFVPAAGSPDPDVPSNALVLGSGSIVDLKGNPVNLLLPPVNGERSLSGNAAISIAVP